MTKEKFRFNPETLAYEKIVYKGKEKYKRILRISSILLTAGLSINIFILFSGYSPEVYKLKLENIFLQSKLKGMTLNIDEIKQQLVEIQQNDDNLYRPIFEIEPISSTIRMAGFGGVDKYQDMDGYENSSLVVDLTRSVDELSRQIYFQSKSYDLVIEKALEKQEFIDSRPSIKPLSDNDYYRISDYFGWRLDPFTKRPTTHHGIDFAGQKGKNVIATGKGVVTVVRNSFLGYGRIVIIDHGFGYKTKYAHLQKILVKEGQKINRGHVIGTLGNSGRSTGPHLHYEVLINNKAVNPVYFFNNDISPEEYDKMLQLLSKK